MCQPCQLKVIPKEAGYPSSQRQGLASILSKEMGGFDASEHVSVEAIFLISTDVRVGNETDQHGFESDN